MSHKHHPVLVNDRARHYGAILAVLILFMAYVIVLIGPQQARATHETAPLDVMTWNIKRGLERSNREKVLEFNNTRRYAEKVVLYGADVVGLQEITGAQANDLAGRLQWGPPFYIETRDPCGGIVDGRRQAAVAPFGNAIISRYTLAFREKLAIRRGARR